MDDYSATYEASEEVFSMALHLAERIGGTLGLTKAGRLVITLPESNAPAVSAGITDDDFPFGYVVAGTDSVLVFEF